MGTKVEKVQVRGQHLTVRDMQRGSRAQVWLLALALLNSFFGHLMRCLSN